MYQEPFVAGIMFGLLLAALLIQFKKLRGDVNGLIAASQVKEAEVK